MLASLMLTAALAASQQTPARLETKAWIDLAGQRHALQGGDAKATVLLFVATDCPISNRFAPEYRRMVADYQPKGVQFLRVYIDDTVPKEDIDRHTVDFDLKMPALMDGKHQLVKELGITVTPEAAVILPDGTLAYRGRINDTYAEHGRFREGEIRQDVRVALDEILSGKPVSMPYTQAIGCGIPDIR